MTPTVTAADVRAAAELLRGVSRVTPLEGSRALSEAVGGPVFFKCENLQRAGSFKIRGAYTRLARLTAGERSRGVVAASAGNHAQGVALAASLLGIPALVVMPEGAPLPKIAATRSYGAEVQLAGQTVDESLVVAKALAAESGRVFVHPFDHADIVAGQGTVALEILEQCPEVRTVVVCTGGGGLLAGMGVVLVERGVTVVGSQAEGAAAWPASLAAGEPVPLSSMSTIADGIAVGRPGDIPFDLVQRNTDRIVTVSDEAIAQALLLCLERAKLVVEPAGAAAAAAVLAQPSAFEPPVVITLSGGNIDPLLLNKVIRRGLVAAGRFLALRMPVPDQPGSLAALLDLLAHVGANVLDVEHSRMGSSLSLNQVEVAVRLETRGPTHAEAVVAALNGAGYDPRPA